MNQQATLGTKITAGLFLWVMFGLPVIITVAVAVWFLLFVARLAMLPIAVLAAAVARLQR